MLVLLFQDEDDGDPDLGNVMVSEWIGTSNSGAVFDSTRLYRYSLWRRWAEPWLFDSPHWCNDMVLFLMLNPSTGDESENDPTINRCIQFTKDWGYNGLVVANIFAIRATDPIDMKKAGDPVGPENNRAISYFVEHCAKIITAWGNHGIHNSRSTAIRDLLRGRLVHHLGLTQAMEPKHPLYLKASTQPTLWKGI